MIKHWTIFEGSPNTGDRNALRVTLNPKKVLLLNRPAFEALGSPAAVELRFDEGTRTIGLTPRDPRHANAFPLKPKGTGYTNKRLGGSPKYSYRILHAAPFCKHFDIRPQRTVLFNNIDIDPQGTMLLELSQASTVGRGSR